MGRGDQGPPSVIGWRKRPPCRPCPIDTTGRERGLPTTGDHDSLRGFLCPTGILFCFCLRRDVTNIPAGLNTNQSCMTIRAAGSRCRCRSHSGNSRPLRCHVTCSSVLFVGVPLTDAGGRDLKGSFLIFSVGPQTPPPPPITTSTRGLLLTAAEVKAHHHISLAAEEEDVRDKLAAEYGRVVAAVPQNGFALCPPTDGGGEKPMGAGTRRGPPHGGTSGCGGGPVLPRPRRFRRDRVHFPGFR